mgnify:CR=1 FL=1
MYNRISSYNKEALWTHQSLVGIDLADNVGLSIPGNSEIDLPQLSFLSIANNEVTVDTFFDANTFPSLLFLYLNGNELRKFPDQSLQTSLVKLGVARCNLKELPSYLSDFRKLRYLDARDNNVTFIDKNLKALIANNKVESYFSGNHDLCNRDKSLDCEPLCSKYCWSRNVIKDGYCDIECNDELCNFDGGDCVV